MYDTLLFLHVLSATFLVAAVVMYTAYVLGGPIDRPSWIIAEVLWGIGGLGTLVFGVWLALYLDAYGILDGWIAGAVILWALATGAGQEVSRAMKPAGEGPVTVARRVLLAHWARTFLVVALLADMIWKPGA